MSTHVNYTQAQRNKLDSLGVSYRLSVDRTDEPSKGKDPMKPHYCDIIDDLTGQTIISVNGHTQQEAFDEAVETISPDMKPLTPAQTAAKLASTEAENERLRGIIDSMRSEGIVPKGEARPVVARATVPDTADLDPPPKTKGRAKPASSFKRGDGTADQAEADPAD